ncbi:hypothetical protein [Candidatus Coxiella mudrowiae]|uniref:hypothetical protein n=1 Tax=Candidatus Coxiella mudrowiae TaxID=2054173 RepID=UPI0012FECC1C|nr:hypothetical protein [Candidatus Coxiella mudrowiae]
MSPQCQKQHLLQDKAFKLKSNQKLPSSPHDPNVHISPLDEAGVKAANLSSTTGKSEEGVDTGETTI